MKQDYQIKLHELNEREKRLRKSLHASAFSALHKVKGQIASLRRSKLSAKSILNSIDEIYMDLDKQLEESPEEEKRQDFIRQLKLGDKVRVRSLNQIGKLSKIDTEAKQVVVQLGMMQMSASLDEIVRVEG